MNPYPAVNHHPAVNAQQAGNLHPAVEPQQTGHQHAAVDPPQAGNAYPAAGPQPAGNAYPAANPPSVPGQHPAVRPHEPLPAAQVQAFAEIAARLAANISGVVLGKPQVVRLTVTALFAQGHLLLEDVPGVGKTTLARAIAASVQGKWRRIQFTPDLLPVGRHRGDHLQPGHPGVRVPPGSGLRQHRHRRRDQPSVAEDPVRAAGGDGGALRHRGRRTARGAPAVPCGGHPEPGRDGRHLPAARGTTRPVPDEAVGRVSRRGGRDRGAARCPGPLPRRPRGGHRHRHGRRDDPLGAAASTSPTRSTRTPCAWRRRPGATRRCGSGSARAASSR